MTVVASAAVELEPTLSPGFRRTVEREAGHAGDAASGTFGRRFGRRAGADATSIGSRVGGQFKASFTKVAGTAFAAVLAGRQVVGFLKDSVGEAREAQKVGAVTEQIIKSTGKSAKVSAAQVGSLAERLSRKAGVDDEAIQSGSNLLLTFKKVRNEVGQGNKVFDRATAAAVDLSAAGFGSITGASKMLGKALNDPVKGISALGRAGVTFSEAQKKQIKDLVASGKTLEAQKIILREVESQVGGTAAASATAGEKAAVAWGNLKEQLGTLLLPVIDRVAGALSEKVLPAVSGFLDQLQSGKGAGGVFARVVSTIFNGLVGLFDLIVKGDFSARLRKAFGWAEDSKIVDVILDIRDAIGNALGPVIEKLTKFMRKNPAVVKAFAITLGILAAAIGIVTLATTAFSIALNSTGIPLLIIGIAALVAGLIYAYKHSDRFRAIVDKVGQILRTFAGWVRDEVVPVVVDLAQKVAEKLQPVWAALVDFFHTSVLPVAQQIIAKLAEWQPAIQRVAGVVVQLVAKWIGFVATVAGKVLPIIIKVAGWLLRNLWPALAGGAAVIGTIISKLIAFGRNVYDAGQKIADFAKKVGDKIGKVVTWITGLPGKAKTALGDLATFLVDSGKALIQGFIDGMKSMVKPIEDAASWVVGKVNKYVPWSPVKKGPLTKWNGGKPGKNLMKMFADGIRAGAPGVIKATEKFADGIDKALKKKQLGKKLAAHIKGVMAGIGKAAQALQDAISARNDLAGSVASNLMGEFNLSEITAKNEFGLSQGPAAAVQVAQSIVARMRAFGAQLVALVKAGLPAPLVNEIAGYGSVEGSRVADVFLQASKSQMASLRTSYSQFQAATAAAGLTVANATYGGKIGEAERNLEKAIERGLSKMGLKVDVGIGKNSAIKIYKMGKNESEKRG